MRDGSPSWLAVLHIFEEVASTLHGAAKVRHEPGEDGLTVVHLAPTRNSAAPISAAIESDGSRVYLNLGQATPIEIDAEGGNFSELSALDEISEVVRQVVEGNFEETIWSKGGTIVKAVGRFTIGGERARIHYESLQGGPFTWIRHVFTATKKEHHRYSPYV